MKQELVSIIVPIYNVEQYLDKCISSILSQSYKNIELILVDDGSTDGSGIICDQYASADPRIRVFHETNGGPASARKKGIKHAKGKYVGFVDGDDYIEEKMYESLISALEEMQVDFIHSGYMKNGSQQISVMDRKKYTISEKADKVQILKEMILNPVNEESISPSMWSKLFKREVLIKEYFNIPDKLSYGEDLICLCLCVLECSSFGILPEAYYHYILREDSICNERKMENIQRETKLYESLRDLFREYGMGEQLQDDVERFYLRNLRVCMKNLTKAPCPIYQYPDIEELKEKRIVLYGMGEVGQDYYIQFCMDLCCTVVAVIDKHGGSSCLEAVYVAKAEEIRKMTYDIIVIAVLHRRVAEDIQDELIKRGVERGKIVWKRPKTIL